jgi:hypothetical protein
MSTRNLPGVKDCRSARKTDKAISVPAFFFKKIWEPRCLTIPWASTTCYKDVFTFPFTLSISHLDTAIHFFFHFKPERGVYMPTLLLHVDVSRLLYDADDKNKISLFTPSGTQNETIITSSKFTTREEETGWGWMKRTVWLR